MVDKLSFYTPGKLLISGEYVVLDGACAFAVPLKLGQQMDVYSFEEETDYIEWTSEDTSGVFFSGKFSNKDFSIIEANDAVSGDYVSGVLKGAKELNPHFLSAANGRKVNCTIEFSRNYGFGSSSTLICNIAKWAGVDALTLNALVTSGSGYDVAVGMERSPIIYQLIDGKSESYKVEINYKFTDKLWFIYLGNKQSSASSVLSYNPDEDLMKRTVAEITALTNSLIDKKSTKGFKRIVRNHEELISKLIGKEQVKNLFFKDFNGEIKSMGAWGGDFVLAVSDDDPETVRNYFIKKGYDTIFSFDELVDKKGSNVLES